MVEWIAGSPGTYPPPRPDSRDQLHDFHSQFFPKLPPISRPHHNPHPWFRHFPPIFLRPPPPNFHSHSPHVTPLSPISPIFLLFPGNLTGTSMCHLRRMILDTDPPCCPSGRCPSVSQEQVRSLVASLERLFSAFGVPPGPRTGHTRRKSWASTASNPPASHFVNTRRLPTSQAADGVHRYEGVWQEGGGVGAAEGLRV